MSNEMPETAIFHHFSGPGGSISSGHPPGQAGLKSGGSAASTPTKTDCCGISPFSVKHVRLTLKVETSVHCILSSFAAQNNLRGRPQLSLPLLTTPNEASCTSLS